MIEFINVVGLAVLGDLFSFAIGLITGVVVVLSATSIFRGRAVYQMGE